MMHTFRRWLILAFLMMSRIPMAEAQTGIGGHIGVVFPLVTHAAGTTTKSLVSQRIDRIDAACAARR
jgi:hypothetical protein